MSAEPRPADSLQQLKELMLGDEQRELAALRERLERLDGESVDRLARDLAAALHRRREDGGESFEEWVAALQDSMESAIQRSVTEDKSRLSRALFPIMGPAIRNYVIDLFRGMVEDLNETIQETTSAERLRWRVQAKLAGKSYSEYVLLKTRAFRVEEVYLMQRDTGLLLLHAARNPEDEADGEADLVSGMFTAIRSFVRDSFSPGETGDDDASELDGFTFGEREVVIEAGPAMVLAVVVHGVPPTTVRDDLKVILEELHGELGGRLDSFSGDMANLESGRPLLRRALLQSLLETSGDGEARGGGLWRAWVFLGVVTAAVVTVWWMGWREGNQWRHFEERLRAEPGVAVTSVDPAGWWRQRVVRGLRDPLAADPAALAAGTGIDLSRTRFEFSPMLSLEAEFAERREADASEERRELLGALDELRGQVAAAAGGEQVSAAISGLRSDLEALESRQEERHAETASSQSGIEKRLTEALVRSEFGGVPGLTVSFSGEGRRVSLSGALRSDDLKVVLARAAALATLIEVDSSGVSDDSAARLAELSREIESNPVLYQSGTMNEEDEATIAKLTRLTQELDAVAAELGKSHRIQVLAHPLIGENREANRQVESRRAEQVARRLIEAGIEGSRVETGLSEAPERAGGGVQLRAILDEKKGGPRQ